MNYKIAFLLTLLAISPAYSLLAQSPGWIEFSGRVIDKESGEALVGASVFFENHSHIGTFSIEDGSFTVRIPKSLENDVVIVSFLGFERKYIQLNSINLSKSNPIELERSSILLNEIVVVDEGRKLRQIILKAVNKIPSNYPSKPHLIEGLYRKVSTEGASYTHLEEAAVAIEDYDYKKPITSLKIMVVAFRQTPDFGKVDSVQLRLNTSLRRNAADKFQVASNPLYRTYEGNFLRFFNKDGNTFNVKTLSSIIEKHYEFKVLGFERVNSDTVLQIAFSEGITPPEPSGRNYFKINMTDLSIVEFQFTTAFFGKLAHQTLVRFKKEGQVYYPSYIKVTQPRYISRDLNSDEYDISTYWFDMVTIGKFEKISSKKSSNRFEYFYGESKHYDSSFWNSYAPLSNHPLEPHIKASLERNGSIEKQFQQNGHK